MMDFTVTLDNKEYKCSSTSSNGKGGQSWNIEAAHGNLRTTIYVPMDNSITRAKLMLFIEAFHVAMHKAFEVQQLDQNYIWNQKHSIS